jgi:hypothetical protein
MGMRGFPTLMYGSEIPAIEESYFLEEYNDDTSFEDMYRFSQKTLHPPVCSPGNAEPCDD